MDLETKGFKLVDRMICLTNTFVGILVKDADDGAVSRGEETSNCGDGWIVDSVGVQTRDRDAAESPSSMSVTSSPLYPPLAPPSTKDPNL